MASTAGVAFTTASLISSYILLATGTAQGGGHVLSGAELLGVYTAVLVLLGLINTLTVKIFDIINEISGEWFAWLVPGCSMHAPSGLFIASSTC